MRMYSYVEDCLFTPFYDHELEPESCCGISTAGDHNPVDSVGSHGNVLRRFCSKALCPPISRPFSSAGLKWMDNDGYGLS